MQLTQIHKRHGEISITFYRREIYWVIGPNTGKLREIKNGVKICAPHFFYGLISGVILFSPS